jgi:hypothetical protein
MAVPTPKATWSGTMTATTQAVLPTAVQNRPSLVNMKR